MNDKEAIAAHHREKRINGAESGDAKRLAEVETAATTMLENVTAKKAELIEQGDLSEQGIANHLAGMVNGWLIARQDMVRDVIDPIEQRHRDASQATGEGLPERNDAMREVSAHFKTLKGDQRQEAIVRAITGKDALFAAALATDPVSDLIPEDLEAIRRQVQSEDSQKQHANASDMIERARSARATVHDVTVKLSGVTTT